MASDTQYQVLLLHGFTGSSHDMEPLRSALTSKGMRVESAVLKGHETSPEDMINARMEDWILDAQEVIAKFDDNRPKIIVALSMGTFLAALLAADKSHRIDGIALLSPAFALTPPGRFAVFLLRLGVHRFVRFIQKRGGSDIRDREARRVNRSYQKIPLRSLVEFESLRELAISKLHQIACPVFIGFGKHDHTVDIKGAANILKGLKSSRIQTQYFANSAHILPLDFDKKEVCEEVTRFIESL